MGAGVSFAIGETSLYKNNINALSKAQVKGYGPVGCPLRLLQCADGWTGRSQEVGHWCSVLIDSWFGGCRISPPLRLPWPLGLITGELGLQGAICYLQQPWAPIFDEHWWLLRTGGACAGLFCLRLLGPLLFHLALLSSEEELVFLPVCLPLMWPPGVPRQNSSPTLYSKTSGRFKLLKLVHFIIRQCSSKGTLMLYKHNLLGRFEAGDGGKTEYLLVAYADYCRHIYALRLLNEAHITKNWIRWRTIFNEGFRHLSREKKQTEELQVRLDAMKEINQNPG